MKIKKDVQQTRRKYDKNIYKILLLMWVSISIQGTNKAIVNTWKYSINYKDVRIIFILIALFHSYQN